jgi:hypothetical protein
MGSSCLSRRSIPIAIGLGLLLVIGCSKVEPLGAVSGTITLDGKPLPNVLVTFTPEQASEHARIRSMGVSNEAGHFTLRAETQREGALIGSHRVTVEDLAIYDAPRAEDGTVTAMPPIRLPAIYADPLQSPLQVTVNAENQPCSLELKSQ